ncbi:MAG: DUF4124 domain-containing protein [Pseudomonadota bacterium]
MELRPILAIAALFLAAQAGADGAYKWVDEDGVVHYSDVPREGAEVVNLSEYSRNTGARVGPGSRPNANSQPEEPAAPFRYESISVASPTAEETLWNIEGVLNVTVAVSPGLQTGHQLRVYFDGNPRIVEGTSFQIDEVWRGVHNLQAEVIDETGRLMIRSQTNRFYVQQNTVISR